MIQRYLLSTLLTLVVAASASAQVTYQNVSPISYDRWTRDIVWADANTVYGVGMQQTPGAGVMQSVVLKSTNAGDNFTMISRQGTDLWDLDVVSPTKVITVGKAASCGCAMIEISTDGGTTWTTKTFPGTNSLRTVEFVSATTGFAMGEQGSAFKTTDGGTSWTNFGPGINESVTFEQVSFPNETVGYAIAMYTALTEANRIYKTTDAGQTWAKILDPGQDLQNGPVFKGIWATTPDVIFVAGREIVRKIFRSTNGGANWTTAYSGLPSGQQVFNINQVEFTSDSVGWASGDLGGLFRTTNGGIIWNREDPATQSFLWGIGYKDRNTGVVGGPVGLLLKRVATILPTINVSDETLDFGKITTGSKDMTVYVSAENSAGLTITGIELSDFDEAGFELIEPEGGFPIDLQEGEELEVIVRFTPIEGLNSRVFGSLTIESNDAALPSAEINLVADATVEQENPVISISTSNLAFGSIMEGTTKELSLLIAAESAATLSITSLRIDSLGAGGNAFTIVTPTTGFPIELVEGGEALTVTVRYAPLRPTEFPAAADLVILSNDIDNTELRVSLSGSATEDPTGIEDETLASALAITTTPNPVTGDARIAMTLPRAGHLSVRLLDARGAVAATLLDEESGAGTRSIGLDAAPLTSGTYTLVVTLDGRTATSRVTIAK